MLLWMVLVGLSFLVPNEFFMFYGSYLCQSIVARRVSPLCPWLT